MQHVSLHLKASLYSEKLCSVYNEQETGETTESTAGQDWGHQRSNSCVTSQVSRDSRDAAQRIEDIRYNEFQILKSAIKIQNQTEVVQFEQN